MKLQQFFANLGLLTVFITIWLIFVALKEAHLDFFAGVLFPINFAISCGLIILNIEFDKYNK